MELLPKNKNYIIAISCVDHLINKSGTAKVILEHQKMYMDNNISYVSLFSIKKRIFHENDMIFNAYGLIVDGKYKGIFQVEQIIKIVIAWNEKCINPIDIHIHHLLYNKMKNIHTILDFLKCVPIKVYLHDYYIACSNYNLMKNKEIFCGGVGLKKEICGNCNAYRKSRKNAIRFKQLFFKNLERIKFVAPSEIVKEIFLKFYPEYMGKIIVFPHQVYNENYRGNLERINSNRKVRVGYLGMPSNHKGWDVWLKVVERALKHKCEFIIFNNYINDCSTARTIGVAFNEENINAMTDALRDEKIDVVLLWSKCPETYSYTCFEAFSANAFIITNRISGNIADTVMLNNNGVVLNSDDELIELFKNPSKLIDQINQFKKSTVGGPLNLYPNDNIVSLSASIDSSCNFLEVKEAYNLKPINYPLIKLLNLIYCRKSKLK